MSRYLLDTHVWLWLQSDPQRIRPAALRLLADASNEILLSAASAWEIAIKYAIGKLDLPEPPATYVPDRMRRSGTTPLAIDLASALRTADLPAHHSDPFDRVLVAQAQVLEVPLVSADARVRAYDIDLISA